MKLRSVNEVLPETRVILKLDLDVPMSDGTVTDNSRLVKSLPTIKLLLEKKCRLAIIGKLGRPEGHDPELSLRPVYLELMSLLEPGEENLIDSVFVEDISNLEKLDTALVNNQIIFLENLRFWKGEENNDPDFLRPLVEVNQFFVNDALAVSHRYERSNLLYKNLPGFYGLAFIDEVEKILKVVNNPLRPITVILGGVKEDKLSYLPELEKIADHVLIGGKLPQLISNDQNYNSEKVFIAKLRADALDLSDDDIAKFSEIIRNSKTIIWAGAMGFFEKEDCRLGTQAIATAVANSQAYKIIAGGDTGASIKNLGLESKIDLIASGGGVMLELLTKGSLPAWN
ncbi:phosphoglycerate kinase [Candidatus Shapirobacteria bacterium]|nr:phosphoglycerate kinase [Candidatus Shapirobacteria bacterium]